MDCDHNNKTKTHKCMRGSRKGCHRCLVIYEKHKNVLQYKESECEGDNMFMDQSNPAAMSIQQMRSTILKSEHSKGGAHPNFSRLLSSSDQYSSRSNDDTNDNCKHQPIEFLYILIIHLFILFLPDTNFSFLFFFFSLNLISFSCI